MARPVWLDYADTCYLVLSRGSECRDIFIEKDDYLKFLDLLAALTDRFKIDIHAPICCQLQRCNYCFTRSTPAPLAGLLATDEKFINFNGAGKLFTDFLYFYYQPLLISFKIII